MNFAKFFSILAVFIAVTSCSQKEQKSSWTEGMRGMANSIESLIPYIYNENRFQDPNSHKFISAKLNDLEFYSDSLDAHFASQISGGDPLFNIGLSNFKRNIQRAKESYAVGSSQYSQDVLQHSVNYCVQCHMRTNMGRSFLSYNQFEPALMESMDTLELAKVKVATRQFENATDILKKEIEDPATPIDARLQSLKIAIAIMVKNQNQPLKAKEYLDELDKKKKLPGRSALFKVWKKNLSDYSKNPNAITIEQAMVSIPKKDKDVRFIELLYRSQLLHQSLPGIEDNAKKAGVLSSLGQIYENEVSLGYWELPDHYYEACIIVSPNSPIARKCYFNLESRIRFAYKLGVNEKLPQEDLNYLRKLKVLSESGVKKQTESRNYEGL